MKLIPYAKWQIKSGLISVAWFFAVYGLVILTLILTLTMSGVDGTVGSDEISVSITLFVNGIVFFSVGLKTALANSVSRRTVFLGHIVSTAALSAVAAVGVLLLNLLFNLVSGATATSSLLFMLYEGFFGAKGALAQILIRFCGIFSTCFLVMTLGTFIGGAYYRMGRLAKILVSILIPVSLTVGLPVLLPRLPQAAKLWLSNTFSSLGRFLIRSPFNLCMFLLILAAVCFLFVWLLLRRAPLKATR